jgi:hypothetical protein
VDRVTTQPGIFALGTPEHGYLELDLERGRSAADLVRGVAGLSDPLSTTGGVNLMVGFRPELCAEVAPGGAPVDGEELQIFRRNVAYGGVTEHGTAFVGFAPDRWRLHEMLRRMAGATDGVRDGLTGFLTPLTGVYYTCPAVEALARFAPPDEG